MHLPRRFLLAVAVTLACGGAASAAELPPGTTAPAYPPIHYHRCKVVGKPWHGRLVNGTRLPKEGQDFFTWDPVKKRKPNRWWRRYSCDFTIRKLLRVLRKFRERYPDAPRVGIGDMSRPRGGPFGERFGGLGHASHQNGVDVDVYYPRLDRRERAAKTPEQVDLVRAQALVDLFVQAGAKYAFVGPDLGLTGPAKIVQRLAYHDDHVHVRFRTPASRR
jgi:murein endopeptidase